MHTMITAAAAASAATAALAAAARAVHAGARDITLQFQDALCIEAREGAVLRVLEGAVWLMEAGVAQDRLCTEGDAVVLNARGKAWLEACAASRLELLG